MNKRQTRLLFVCMGNICRSPTAEGIMLQLIRNNGLENLIKCDSAGTHGYHVGEPAEVRMRKHAQIRGYDLPSRARKIHPASDFPYYNLILVMDDRNYQDVRALDSSREYASKIRRMTDFCERMKENEIPDPYYGGDEGFELVIDILEDACAGLMERLKAQ